MTSRERLLTVIRGEIPDCVPVAPDFSNMIPARLTGMPFWDLYLYRKKPIWEAYIECAKHFDIDSVMDGYFPLTFPEETAGGPEWETFVVRRDAGMIVTQRSYLDGRRRVWTPTVTVYYVADPPTWSVTPDKVGLPPEPKTWEPLEGVREVDTGPEGLKHVLGLMGDQGLVGVRLGSTLALHNEAAILNYYDHPELHDTWVEQRIRAVERRFELIQKMDVRPDFLTVGGSGTLVFQSPEIFRRLALPAVKRGIELATAAGFPTQVHSCGPETELVRIMANETDLTIIDPLEIPPMGDCNLAELKREVGHKIVLKGNLHTTEVMLRGSTDDVRRAAIQAMRDGGTGGRFILSTGDQCGRDTPDENLRTLVETARTCGVYDRETGTLPHLPAV
jgi:uroporphyrinogen decarboxylase